MTARLCSSAVAALLCLLLVPQLFAQATISFAQLNGTVLDASGRVVVGATVTARETNTNRTYTAQSNADGYYFLPSLPPGAYELTTVAQGFAKYTQTGIRLTVGQTATLNVNLKVASVGETVTVNTEVPPVETTRTEISQVIDTKQIDSLPISGRQFTDFALLTPGVATGRTSLQSTITEFEVTRVSFAGMRDLSNEVTVDGADNINTATGSQRSTPPQEAVSEFRVVNNSFGAEYGRAMGGIVNIVTKSGTNKLHGSLYEYLQNNATDARSVLQPSPSPYVLRQNQFGIALGGPIQQDKTFFFMNYEGQRRGESPTFPDVLTSNLSEINAAKAILGIQPENLGLLKTKDSDFGIIKIDHSFNPANQLSMRYNVEDARDLNQLVGSTLDGGGIGAPSSGHNVYTRDQSLVGSVNSVVKPNLVNTFLAQFGRRHYSFPGVTGQPNLDIPNTLLFGHNFGVLDNIWENRLQFSDTVAWIKGNHSAKFGFDSNYIRNFVTWPGFTPMRIVLPGLNCLADFSNFVYQQDNGVPNPNPIAFPTEGPCPLDLNPLTPYENGIPIIFWGAPVGSGPLTPGFLPPAIVPNSPTWPNAYLPSQAANFDETLNHSYFGWFFQDQWRATPKLTLNYGLRYDFETGLSKQIDPHYDGVQPRIGIAYSPSPKTVIRSGFGIFDDRYNLSFLFITQPQRPVIIPGVTIPGVRKGADTATWILNQEPSIGLPSPICPGAPICQQLQEQPSLDAYTLLRTGQVPAQYITGPQGSLVTAGAGLVDHRSPIPYSEQASLEIDQEISHGLTVSAGYLFASAHHQVRAENLNVCPTQGTNNPGVAVCAPGGTPPPGFPAGKAYFSGPLYTNAGLLYFTDNSGNSIYHGLTLQAAEKYGSYLRFQANYTFSKTLDDGTFTTFVSTPQDLYNRPAERALSNQDVRHRFIANFTADGPSNSFVRNFELSGIVTVQSPRPFTLFVGFDANNDTNPVTDRVGYSPRNTYEGDNLRSVDLRLSRYFHLTERLRLDLSMDAFNLFNRNNVDEVTSVYGTYNFCGGLVPQHFGDRVTTAIQNFQVGGCPLAGPPIPNPQFGGPRTVLNPRQLQFGAKFSF
jgi:hypothetical protein